MVAGEHYRHAMEGEGIRCGTAGSGCDEDLAALLRLAPISALYWHMLATRVAAGRARPFDPPVVPLVYLRTVDGPPIRGRVLNDLLAPRTARRSALQGLRYCVVIPTFHCA